MVTVRGRSEVSRFIAALPGDLQTKVLRGAARAGAKVIAEEAKDRVISSEVRGAIKVASRREDSRAIGLVQVKGPGAYIAPWLEYGTSQHFISVDDSQRQGLSVNRINKLHGEGSLVINGAFVGTTVLHPGARPYPFLRPALDLKAAEAINAAQLYINGKISRHGIVGGAEAEDVG